MKEINKISDVFFQPKIIKERVFFIEKVTRKLICYQEGKFDIYDNTSFSSLTIIEDLIFLDDFYFMNLKTHSLTRLENIETHLSERASVSFTDDNKIVYKIIDSILEKVRYCFLDVKSKSLHILFLKEGISNPKKISQNIIVCSFKDTITTYYIDSGLFMWNLSVNELGSYTDELTKQKVSGRIEELIVVDDSILVASVHRYGILGISLQTGAILWQIPNIQNVVLHERVLYSFSDFYFEIDAITGQVVRQEDYKTLFKNNNFRTYWLTKPAISENLIAIASHYDNALLLLDRTDFSISQRLELGKASNGIPLTNTPQIHLNRLYQLDGDNTLHIFEQEA